MIKELEVYWSEKTAGKFERRYEDFEEPLTIEQRTGKLLVTTPVVEGLDINRFQRGELLDATAIYESGRRFVILEATWGLWVPPSFAEFWPPLLDAGLILMGYGFFCGNLSGEDQADLLLNTVSPMYEAQGYWMPLFSDLERFVGDPSTPAGRRSEWYSWVRSIRERVRPGVYSNVPSWATLMNNAHVDDDVICWPAHHANTIEPSTPPGWRKDIHQYGIAKKHEWCPAVPGMAGDVDVDRAYMTVEQLRALGDAVVLPPPPPPPPIPIPEPEPEMDILENAKKALEEFEQMRVEVLAKYQTIHPLLVQLVQQAADCEKGVPPVPTPLPPPSPVVTVDVRVVRVPKGVAQYSLEKNASGNPKMEPYPRAGSSDQRITWETGEFVKVLPSKVQGDGGKFWQIEERKGRAGETLFFKEEDVQKV